MPKDASIDYKYTDSVENCVQMAHEDSVDVLLFTCHHVVALRPLIENYKINSIVWIHNWIRGELIDNIAECDYVKRAVFLVREHYDRYIDDAVIQKAVFIPNMFNTEGYLVRNDNLKNVVTYVGAIVPGKGFHVLAKEWKNVLAKVPDAELYVLGKGNLYGTKSKFGVLGLAEESYENSFSRFLMDKKGQVLPSVHLMGIMGSEKSEVYARTKVGVVNPTGRTEVCPISALEMEAAGIPVVSKNTNGLPDVVKNKVTGFLIGNEKTLSKAIIELLNDNLANNQYSLEARRFVEQKFNPKKISKMWFELFKSVANCETVKIQMPVSNYTNNYKWLRILNFKIKTVLCFKRLPSIIAIEGKISKLLRGI